MTETIIIACVAVASGVSIILAYVVAFRSGYKRCIDDLMLKLATDKCAVEDIKAEIIAIRIKELLTKHDLSDL